MRAGAWGVDDGEQERPALERAIEDRLFAIPEIGAAGTILFFYSFGTEVETTEIAQRLHDQGRRLFLPYLSPEGMETAEVGPEDPLVPTTYGPMEPARREPADPAAVDAVITPGLAFDRGGRRLGYGGGHYDRYLTRLHPEAVRVGIAFSVQLIDEVPGEFDVVFCDIDKEGYPDAWRAARERIRVGGLYLCDNILWSGQVAEPEADHGRDEKTTDAILEHNRLVAEDERYVSSIVPTRDGVFVALRVS